MSSIRKSPFAFDTVGTRSSVVSPGRLTGVWNVLCCVRNRRLGFQFWKHSQNSAFHGKFSLSFTTRLQPRTMASNNKRLTAELNVVSRCKRGREEVLVDDSVTNTRSVISGP